MPTPLDSQYWSDEEDAMWAALIAIYIGTLSAGMDGGIEALPPALQALVSPDTFNRGAQEYARKYRYELIKGINDTTRTQVQTAMQEWILSNEPLSSLEARLEPIFGSVRAEMISSTEVSRIFADANLLSWESTGFVDGYRFNTSVDDKVCPQCGPRDGQIYAIDDTFNKPPIHIRCRCYLTPQVSEEAVQEQVEAILNG